MLLTIVDIIPAKTESIVSKIKLLCILWQRAMVALYKQKDVSVPSISLMEEENRKNTSRAEHTPSHRL